MLDISDCYQIVIPGPCKVVIFPMLRFAEMILYLLTPEERGTLWTERAVRVNILGVGPVAFICAEQVDEQLGEID